MPSTLTHPTPLSLLDPRSLAKVSRMELVARQVMDGYVQGMHRSPHVGFALDFAQHRPYVPGDDVKRIDWRVYAQAHRVYNKQDEVSTNPPCHLVLDASGPKAHPRRAHPTGQIPYAPFLAPRRCFSPPHP